MPQGSDAVWLPVLPDMSKFGPAIGKGAGPAADKQGMALGKKLGLGLVAGVAVVGAAGKVLYDVGKTFDEMSDTIRQGTGASGEALDGLVESAKNVGRNVPAEFGAIGTTLADLNTRLGLTGPVLETLSAQFLEAGRMGEAIDVASVTASFNAFKVEGEDATAAMDYLFQVSQATGVGINELASSMASNAPAVQALGFSFEETAGLVGSLDKAGLNTSSMMTGMSRALVNLAKDGEEPQEAFKRVTDELGSFIAAGDTAAAMNLAEEVFGTRNASQFVGAIESGALAMEDLSNVAGMTDDTILGVANETKSMSEKWQEFKNNALLTLEPVATRVFDSLSGFMAWVTDTGVPAVQAFGEQIKSGWTDGLTEASGPMEKIGAAAKEVFDYVTDTAIPALKDMGKFLGENKDVLLAVGAALVTAKLAAVAYNAYVKIVAASTAAWNVIQKVLNGTMKANPIGIVITVLGLLVGAVVLAYQKSETFRDIVDAAWSGIKTAAQAAWGFLRDKVFPAFQNALAAIGEAAGNAKETFKKAWDGLKEIAAKPINFVIETVYMGGIKKTFDAIADAVGLDLKLPTVRPVRFAAGGVLPGYTPGRDVHDFYSQTGGRLALSGGEAIMRPEWTRAVGGPGAVAAMNTAARRGQAFAGGGVFDWLGDAGEWIGGKVSGAASWVADKAKMVAKVLSDPVGAMTELVMAPVQNLLGGLPGGGIMKAITDTLPRKAVGGLIDAVKRLVGIKNEESGSPWTGGRPIGWQSMVQTLKSVFPDLGITSTYRPGAVTAVGTRSYHGMGRAVDMAPSMRVFNWLASNFPGSAELLYSPAGGRQLNRGRPTNTSGITRANHFDHLHWAMKNGGVLPTLYDNGGVLSPGLSTLVNASRKPEAVLSGQQWSDMHKLATEGRTAAERPGVTIQGNVGWMPDELERRMRVRQGDFVAAYGLST